MTIDIASLPLPVRQAWLQHAVAPRPIAFVSTIDHNGNANLSPFSFFNLFSSAPPIIIFSPARSGRTGERKHTLLNVQAIPECVVHICDEAMLHQVSLSSCEYPREVDEFEKAGFTKENASIVKVPMVKEAKIKMECTVMNIQSLGLQPGAGQLVLAEVVRMHVADEIINEAGDMIDPKRFGYIARMGGDYYASINESNLFTVPKPNRNCGMGIDALPKSIRESQVLTGNDLAQLASVTQPPIINSDVHFGGQALTHLDIKNAIQKADVEGAWQMILRIENELNTKS
jgi:flavin reductase (DIM6/NTAB) family NADH-FMN oxidoreductase RutF